MPSSSSETEKNNAIRKVNTKTRANSLPGPSIRQAKSDVSIYIYLLLRTPVFFFFSFYELGKQQREKETI